ncbi:MAG: DUF63 family protein [Candidatus Aenigmarchaeota archaeon]|nr:DUF63 family protein [Candidatus Aenigmarchaeota archaeon]
MLPERIFNPYGLQSLGYTLTETIIYSAVLLIFLYVIFKVIRKLKISFDKRFAIAIAPYVVLGGLLRVLRDLGFFISPILMTPWIYFFIFSLLIVTLLLSLFLQKRFKLLFFKPLFLVGILLAIFPLAFLTFVKTVNFYGIVLVSILFFPWIILFKVVRWSKENRAVSLVQLFDATTTSTAIHFFGYGEQHWLPSILISAFGPFSFVFVKLFVIVVILIALDRLCKEKELKNYIKLVVGILGAATGIRDFTCLATYCIPH